MPVHRLDAFVAARSMPPPDLVKIDAEGAEDAVVEGMGSLLDGPTRVLRSMQGMQMAGASTIQSVASANELQVLLAELCRGVPDKP